jgi:acyl-CoA reductase-like NAD-dependent aldehyde dehydrogenase
MTVDGGAVTGEEAFEVVNPATGVAFATAPNCSTALLDAALRAAEKAGGRWQREASERRNCLARAAQIVADNANELGRLITLEQGKPLAKAVREVNGAAAGLRYAAELEVPGDSAPGTDTVQVEVQRRPIGVVAAITPWNYPVIAATGKIGPALRAGNCVVLKPSPFTPLSTLRLGELLREVFPAGVLNVVSGDDELGRALVRHPAVRKISFTGSIESGRHVLAAAADDFKRTTLELGGNDAAIVLDDVDPHAIAPKLFWGAFQNSGQVCSAIKRLYVHEKVYEPLRDALAEIARTVRVGDGLDPNSELGPLSTKPQFNRVGELIGDARRAGGRFCGSAERLGTGGYFIAPALVEGLSDLTRLVAEEQFGPVLPLLEFSDVDDAIARANATRFGLSGSVWSGDVERARALATRLDCGTVWINQHLVVLASAPISGHKWSGIGVENGIQGLLEFTQVQTVMLPRQ